MHQPIQPRQQLRRSSSGVIGGVCAGLAEYFGISLTFTRAVFIILGLANGVGVVIYIILLLTIRRDNGDYNPPVGAPFKPSASADQQIMRPTTKNIFGYIVGFVAALAAFLANLNTIADAVRSLVGGS